MTNTALEAIASSSGKNQLTRVSRAIASNKFDHYKVTELFLNYFYFLFCSPVVILWR